MALVSRSPLPASASYWAQGGIAAALAVRRLPRALHARDTLTAGRGAARPSAVEVLCEDSPARVGELQALGVRFDADRHGALALGLEGGHSARRIVHAGGAATGRRITRQLSATAATHERIDVMEHTTATALLVSGGRCVGVSVERDGAALQVVSRATVLATGGAAALWARTTNPPGSTGVGLALAHAAGAELADLEFVQFHPTALVSDGPRDGFLVTEAVRGEGATLLGAGGERFVDELAPRDEVALAIESELRSSGAAAVSLDMRSVDLGRFPNIAEALGEVGIDPARDLVPVAPAAHYTMGGVATDLDGRASIGAPLRRGRVRLHGPARGQPAGLQLAGRVLRPGSPRRRGGNRGAPTGRRRGCGRGSAARAPHSRHPRRALAPRRAAPRSPGAGASWGARSSRWRADRPLLCSRARRAGARISASTIPAPTRPSTAATPWWALPRT